MIRYFLEDNKRCFIMIAIGLAILVVGVGFKSMYYGTYKDKTNSYKEQVAALQDKRDLINEEITKTTEKVAKDNMAITEEKLTKDSEITSKFFGEFYTWDSKESYDKAMKAGSEKFGDQKKAFSEKFKVKSDEIEKKKQKSAINSVTLYPRKVEGGTALYYARLLIERTELEGDAQQIETLLSFSINADGDVARVKMMY